jgi:hypothetical protein
MHIRQDKASFPATRRRVSPVTAHVKRIARHGGRRLSRRVAGASRHVRRQPARKHRLTWRPRDVAIKSALRWREKLIDPGGCLTSPLPHLASGTLQSRIT